MWCYGSREFGQTLGPSQSLGDLAGLDVCSGIRQALQLCIHGSLPRFEGRVGVGACWGSPDMLWLCGLGGPSLSWVGDVWGRKGFEG